MTLIPTTLTIIFAGILLAMFFGGVLAWFEDEGKD